MRFRKGSNDKGAILLEVILALVLLAAAAAVIGAGLGQSMDAVERQRLNMHAANLAASVVAEMQLGLRSAGNGPQAFEPPFDHWSWELRSAPVESELAQATALTLVEAVVRHDDPALVYRFAQIIRAQPQKQ
jgi:type II secretory pathway pseudopilin PulG